MISVYEDYFWLNTKNTSYGFRVLPTLQLEHLYYGEKIEAFSKEDLIPLSEKCGCAPGNTIIYDQEHGEYSLEQLRLEVSGLGKGDIREPFIELEFSDGSITTDFVYEGYELLTAKPEYNTLPTAYFDEADNDNPVSLKIIMKDKFHDLQLEIVYTVFEESDVLTKMTKLINNSDKKIIINRLMSNQLDLDAENYYLATFNGAWAREMHKSDMPVTSGKYINSSYTGTSSNRANPFVMLYNQNTTEHVGDCYGFNLIYSGNHYECVERSSYDKVRIVQGINPMSFRYILSQGEIFESPEAVLTFSNSGFNGMSHHMHRFVGDNIVRGIWKKKERPVLLNSWEAFYFNINEPKMLSLAKTAKEVGIELFVMDDGWFGERNDDNHSLGDWTVNKDKLPGGIEGIAAKINKLGMSFGIWVEPEMVNENSVLYKKHPEWVLMNPKTPHSLGRNQMILDLGQEVVQNYIIEEMSKVFGSGNVEYVKWDMNRIVSDAYSQDLPSDRQGESLHRYVTGLYKVIKTLTEKFPNILFEGCASGGNRFDLGMLTYFPQIWASDDTDAYERCQIQRGYSYGYPQSTYTCHVSGIPNHQTLRKTPLETRFNVASAGVLGYECNLSDATKVELEAIKAQVEFYKKHRKTLQYGSFMRGRSIIDTNIEEWSIVSEDKEDAVAIMVQNRVVPNSSSEKLYVKGLLDEKKYEVNVRDLKYSIKDFGDLVNTVAPVHIRQNSLAHNIIDKFYKLDGEKDSVITTGKILSKGGMYLTQKFTGLGLNENIREFQDMGSRIYEISMVK